jgi:hypothetical protein
MRLFGIGPQLLPSGGWRDSVSQLHLYPHMPRNSMIVRTALAILCATTIAAADATEATEAEAAWFAGTWDATRGVAAAGETLIVGTPRRVVIRHLGGARIERDFALPSGAVATTAYMVMRFDGKFPWWTDDAAGNLTTRRIGDDTFHLAQMGNMGKADWDNGWTYVRVATPAGE